MSTANRFIATLSVVMCCVLFLTSPADARDRGSRSGRSHDRYGGSSRSYSHDRSDSRFSIGFGLSNNFYSTSYRRYVPGYYETHTEQVLVEPGHYEWQTHQVQVEPERYELRQVPAVTKTVRDEQGNEHTIVVQPARTETVYIPPKYEQQRIKVWVPDRYETRTIRVWVPGYWISEPYYSSPRLWLNLGGAFRF